MRLFILLLLVSCASNSTKLKTDDDIVTYETLSTLK